LKNLVFDLSGPLKTYQISQNVDFFMIFATCQKAENVKFWQGREKNCGEPWRCLLLACLSRVYI